MDASQLHVIAVRTNPLRWKVPEKIYKEFAAHMISSGVHLTTVECIHGQTRDFEHNKDIHPRYHHIGLRANTVVWVKENLINIGIKDVIRRFPDARYFAWIDADVFFDQADWAVKTLDVLSVFKVCQLFSQCIDRGPNFEIMQIHTSFGHQYFNGFEVRPGTKWAWSGTGGMRFPHPGYAWGATREALEATGGLLETGALGSGDAHMALGLVGMASGTYHNKVHESYKQSVLNWEKLALKHINRSISYVPCTMNHHWHGTKASRAYNDRWSILVKHNFNLHEDVYKNLQGLIELVGNKPEMTRDILHYFFNRREDANVL